MGNDVLGGRAESIISLNDFASKFGVGAGKLKLGT
jgi:hypothetical protein